MILKKFKKPLIILACIIVAFLLFSQTTFGKRVLLEAGVIETIRNFFAGNPELHACDYKDGMVILIKPIATGVGEGRYEAGDIVEIRDGAELCRIAGDKDPLGTDEKTKLLPVYYPHKLTEEQIRELMESTYASDEASAGKPEYENLTENSSPSDKQKMVMRRKYGVDYTKFLNDREILKVRNFEPLKKLPEIDLSTIVKKSPKQKSVVQIPEHIARIENFRNSISKIVRKAIPLTFAGSGTKTICPAGQGCNYTDLNTWEGTEQANLTGTGPAIAQIQGDWSNATDTTAVTIDGWTTTANDYIKIYTTSAARHDGKWNTGKYRLELSTDTVSVINIYENYVRIEGLQLYHSSINYAWGINGNSGVNGEIRISHNIIRGSGVASGEGHGIKLSSISGGTFKIWNNLVYNWSARAFEFDNSVATVTGIIYNNSFVDCGLVYWYQFKLAGTYVTGYTKNNIVQGSSPNYSTVVGTTANNISEDATSPDVDYRNKAVTFVDEANDDFHLASNDAVARNYGTDLSGDFTDDIDGQTRPYGSNWDIGADEFVPIPIYRSVGPNNTSALASSTGATLTISDSTATFSEGLADNIGVGDVIIYNSVGTTTQNSIAFIHSRTNSTTYTVKNSAGKIPNQTSNSTNWQIFRAYTSLSLAEAGTENTGLPDNLENFDTWSGGKNLASSTEIWNIACYADATDTTAVTIDGWTTTADDYIKIYTPYLTSEVGTSQRHDGKWNVGKYRLELTNAGSILAITEQYVRVEGLQFQETASDAGVFRISILVDAASGSSDIRISHNVIKHVLSGGTNYSRGIRVNNNLTVKIWNNVIYDVINSTYTTNVGISSLSTTNIYLYNNTFHNCNVGMWDEGYWTTIAKNNLMKSCIAAASGTFAAGTDYNATDNASMGYAVTGGGNTHDRVSQTFTFVNEANDDFHLASNDAVARNYGTNLSGDSNLAFTDDIDGQTRPGTWDIGADETPTYGIRIKGGIEIKGGIRIKKQ